MGLAAHAAARQQHCWQRLPMASLRSTLWTSHILSVPSASAAVSGRIPWGLLHNPKAAAAASRMLRSTLQTSNSLFVHSASAAVSGRIPWGSLHNPKAAAAAAAGAAGAAAGLSVAGDACGAALLDKQLLALEGKLHRPLAHPCKVGLRLVCRVLCMSCAAQNGIENRLNRASLLDKQLLALEGKLHQPLAHPCKVSNRYGSMANVLCCYMSASYLTTGRCCCSRIYCCDLEWNSRRLSACELLPQSCSDTPVSTSARCPDAVLVRIPGLPEAAAAPQGLHQDDSSAMLAHTPWLMLRCRCPMLCSWTSLAHRAAAAALQAAGTAAGWQLPVLMQTAGSRCASVT
jgi:hypothetical protein